MNSRIRRAAILILTFASLSFAGDKKDKPKSGSGQAVDSGTFGVFVKGQRVITEKFDVSQENGISVVKSELQQVGNPTLPGQKSELQMTASGELMHYDWNDGTGSLNVVPNNDFLLEKIKSSPSAKAAEQPYLMPNTTAILDNNFFIHREVLAWRYLATNCKSEGNQLKCDHKPVEFGVLVPQDRTSLRVRIELAGAEKVIIRGTERELLRLNLMGEEFSWALWIDDKDHFKLVRVLVPDANTEVIRD